MSFLLIVFTIFQVCDYSVQSISDVSIAYDISYVIFASLSGISCGLTIFTIAIPNAATIAPRITLGSAY